MLKKKALATLVAAVTCVSMLAGCGSSAGTETAKKEPAAKESTDKPADTAKASGEFAKAADLKAPAGKKLLSLPADKVSEKPLKIATIMVQNNPFGAAVLTGQEYAKKVLEDRNCVVDCISVEDFDAQKWSSTIQNCIATDYDAICFFGISEALQPVVDEGVDAGILMYAFNTEPGKESKRQAWFGMDDYAAGEACGKALEKLTGGEGEYGIITGDFSVLGHELRRTGARSILDNVQGLKLVGEYENKDKSEEAYNVATNMITANPNLKAIYVTAGGPSGAAKAIEDAGKKGEIILVCHDVLEETAPYIESGLISTCIDQDPFNQGYQPVVAAFNTLVGETAPEDKTFYDAVVATPDNVKDLFPEYFK